MRENVAPADTFALAGRRVIRFSVIYAIAVVLASVLAFAGHTALRNGAADPAELTTQAFLMIGFTLVGMVTLVCGIGLAVSVLVWVISTHQMRAGGPGLAGYGALGLGLLLIVLSFVLPGWAGSVDVAVDVAVVIEAALRIAGAALLVGAALVTRARVRRETGRADLGGRPPLVTSDDWDASNWDPTLQREIDRRRSSGSPGQQGPSQ